MIKQWQTTEKNETFFETLSVFQPSIVPEKQDVLIS